MGRKVLQDINWTDRCI